MRPRVYLIVPTAPPARARMAMADTMASMGRLPFGGTTTGAATGVGVWVGGTAVAVGSDVAAGMGV